MQQRVFTIAENAPVARGTYRLRLAGDTAAITAPGQFVDIRLAGYFLRRPVSVCSWSDGALTLYYKVAGAGTAQLSTLVPGTELDLLVGLGNGFDTAPAGARPLLVGGEYTKANDRIKVQCKTCNHTWNAIPASLRLGDRKSTRLNSSHWNKSRMPSSA